MNICVLSSQGVRHDCEQVGSAVYLKYPRVFSTLAQSLLNDPLLCGRLDEPPRVWELMPGRPREAMMDADLVIVPHAVCEEDEAALLRYGKRGGKVLWVRPSPGALAKATGGKVAFARSLLSHRERWRLPGGTFRYAQMLKLDCYDIKEGEGRYPIGETPGLIRLPGLTVCGGDLFFAHMWYMNSPTDTLSEQGEQNAFQTMILCEVLHLLGMDMDGDDPAPRFFLRRDFHAYGYTRRMVEDLFALNDKQADFAKADQLMHAAAKAFAQDAGDGAVEAMLKPAFEELKDLRDQITDIPVYYADGMHGGILTEEYGYIEIGAPEFVADLFHMFLELGYKRGYHFSCDVSIATFVHLSKRFPAFIDDLRKGMEDGIFEVANGSIGQLYPHLFGLETNIHQFVSGQAAMERLFGRRAESFLAQEMQFTPAYASLLAQSGYKGALHRIQNKGATVYDDEVSVTWRAPGGDELLTIPTHYDDSQQAIATGFALWPELITETAKHYPMGIYTNLLDIVWITLFREEVIRASHYAPVMGEFVTFTELYDRLGPTAIRTYTREDYLPEMQPGTSKMLGDMGAVGRTLEAAEKYAALSGRDELYAAIARAWDGLGEFVNHDNTVCFHVRPKDQTYLPFSAGPDRHGPELYDVLEGMTYGRLKEVTDQLGAPNALFNPLNASRRVQLAYADGEWKPLKRVLDPESVKGIVAVDIAGLSAVPMPGIPSGAATEGGEPELENGILRARLNTATGGLSSLCVDGRELLAGDANIVAAGMEGETKLTGWKRYALPGAQMLMVTMALCYPDGRDGGKAVTCIALADGERKLTFTTKLMPARIGKTLYRTYPHDRAGGIGVRFHLSPSYASVRDCWMHHLHEAGDGKERTYGPGLYYGSRTLEKEYLSSRKGHVTQSAMGLLVEGNGMPPILLHNDGSTLYEAESGTIRSLLWCTYEYGDTFSYALEALGDSDPFGTLLNYQYDLMPVPQAKLANPPKVEGAWLSAHFVKDGLVYYRVVETRGERAVVTIDPDRKYTRAWRVNLLGDRLETIEAKDKIQLILEPHGIATVCIK